MLESMYRNPFESMKDKVKKDDTLSLADTKFMDFIMKTNEVKMRAVIGTHSNYRVDKEQENLE